MAKKGAEPAPRDDGVLQIPQMILHCFEFLDERTALRRQRRFEELQRVAEPFDGDAQAMAVGQFGGGARDPLVGGPDARQAAIEHHGDDGAQVIGARRALVAQPISDGQRRSQQRLELAF